jgi:hypothetical protein
MHLAQGFAARNESRSVNVGSEAAEESGLTNVFTKAQGCDDKQRMKTDFS